LNNSELFPALYKDPAKENCTLIEPTGSEIIKWRPKYGWTTYSLLKHRPNPWHDLYTLILYTVSRKKEANSFLGITSTLVDAVP